MALSSSCAGASGLPSCSAEQYARLPRGSSFLGATLPSAAIRVLGTLPSREGPAPCRAGPDPSRASSVASSWEEAATVSTSGRAPPLTSDPEARYRRYGPDFGKRYSIDLSEMLENVPRIRVRKAADRQRDQLAELTVLNERLAGRDSAAVRRRVDFLKVKRKTWEAIYHYVTKEDAAATLDMIEEAHSKVEALLSPEAREVTSVNELRGQLLALQSQVGGAQQRLQATQSRVAENLQRVQELKREAAVLERLSAMSPSSTATEVDSSGVQAVELLEQPQGSAIVPAPRSSQNAARLQRRRRGLHSSLKLEEGLRNFWYPAVFSTKLVADTLVPFELFNEPWVLFRDEKGAPCCVRDECAHRACPLSAGRVVDGQVECPYHGWRYNQAGNCTKMPSTAFCRGVRVSALQCSEADGFVWVWPGDLPPSDLPSFAAPPQGFDVHAEIEVEVPVEHGLLMENLLDLAHAPFTHTTTFAKGWPVPDAVRFHASRLLGGNWEPYPIEMTFQPPCMVLSTIGLAQPGKIVRGATAEMCKNHLHQLHVCLPSKSGHTRLLYRMSLDFLGWARYVPGIQAFWRSIAGQVLGEDLVLVKGQQERMLAGSDTWANPVSYDKLAVRYRRWRNDLGPDGAHEQGAVASGMTAGQLFSIEESMDTDDE